MTDYNSVPDVSSLYAENERVNQAIANIDAGATATQFTIGMPPVTAPASGETPLALQVPINIYIPPPGPGDQLMRDLRAWLVTRSTDLMNQLAALGVTDAPPTGTRRAVSPGPGFPPPLPMTVPPPPTPVIPPIVPVR